MLVPVSGLPNFSKHFVIETDASGLGVGAVFVQNQRCLAYFSHALPPTHRFSLFKNGNCFKNGNHICWGKDLWYELIKKV